MTDELIDDKPEQDNRIDPLRCSKGVTAYILGVGLRTIDTWINKGCPRNADKTISIPAVFQWYNSREAKKNENTDESLEKQKLKAQIDKLNREVSLLNIKETKTQDLYVLRADMEKILTSRAVGLRGFLERALMMNISTFAMRTIEELPAVFYNFLKDAMEAYCGSNNQKEITDEKEQGKE